MDIVLFQIMYLIYWDKNCWVIREKYYMNKNNKNKMKFLFIFIKIENCIYIGKSDSNFKEGRDDIFINDILS